MVSRQVRENKLKLATNAAQRETSVIFAAVLGAVFLQEHMGKLRLVGAMLIACGAALVRLH